jgi:hypothetical protein
MSEHPPFSITGNVNGVETIWAFDKLEAVMKLWDKIARERLVPGTTDAVTDLRLFYGGDKPVVALGSPYGGLSVP